MTPVYPASYSRLSALSFGGVTFRATAHYPRPVSGSFHSPSRGSFQLSLTVLVRYRTRDVFSLGGWCPPASRENSNPRYSGDSPHPRGLRLRGYHPLRRRIPADFGFTPRVLAGSTYNTTSASPFSEVFGLGCAAFGRPYSRHRVCFLFLRVLGCFLSPRSRSHTGAPPKGQDCPFGDPGFYGSLRLPRAFRSLARPSSAPRAEPSTSRVTVPSLPISLAYGSLIYLISSVQLFTL